MARREQTPHDFTIEKAQIFSEKFVDQDNAKMNIQNLITDLEIFEHLDKPYLTASLAFLDQEDIFNIIDFAGGEKIELEIKLPGLDTISVSKIFVIEKVLKNIKNNDSTAVVVLHLIELHAFESKLINVNKAYTGKPVEIIQKIIKDNLRREFTTVGNDYQSPMRVIIPNMKPIDAAMWIRNRASANIGVPYFFFSTLANEKLHIISLEDMLTKQYDLGEYRYSQSATQWAASQTAEEQSYIIQWYSARNTDEIITFVEKGLVGARYRFYDTMLGRPNSDVKFNIKEILDQLKGNSIISQDQNKLSYSDAFKLNGISFNELASRDITQVVSTAVYDDYYTYSEETDASGHKQKITLEAIKNFLVRNVMDVALPGKNFLNGNYSSTIGNQINLTFLKNDAINLKSPDYYDIKTSGRYLIYSLKHSFKRERYDVIASCVKLGDKNE